MTRAITPWRCAAFALPELAATLVIVGVAVAMLLVEGGAGRARLEHNSAASQDQLRWIAGVTASYAADFQDRQWALSWKAGQTPSSFADLAFAETHRQAASHQAVDILRRRAGELGIPPISNWIPSIYYSHLPLADYLDVALPMFEFVSPADEHTLKWARDPEAFAAGAFQPLQPEPAPVTQRYPYSSSYELGTALATTPASGAGAMLQAETHNRFYTYAETEFEGALHSDITFPSSKVLVFDREQRIAGRRFALQEEAIVLVLAADGSTSRQRTAQTNRGWQPSQPWSGAYTRFVYDPAAWKAQSGAGQLMAGHYRWTRCGPEGRDFGGPEPCGPLP